MLEAMTASTLSSPFIVQPIAKGGGGRTLKWRWPSSTSVLVACAALVVLTTLVVALNPSTIFPFMTAAMPTTTLIGWKIKEAVPRCEKVVELITRHDVGKPKETLQQRYKAFVANSGSFYRGTANLFWHDFVQEGWGEFNLSRIGIHSSIHDDSPLQRTSLWTWVTGDQHLNNFGAWQNRHGDVVFGVNDFDEAIIYDFQMDVWRLGVSVYSQAIANGLSDEEASAAVLTMCDSYVATVEGYIGNERAAVYEISDATATGRLAKWLAEVKANQTHHKMLDKYTQLGADGRRKFKRGKKLRDVSAAFAEEVRHALNGTGYGATMMKIGWHARLWDPTSGGTSFQVVDVAQVIGAGVGSFGVGRYYVLLAAPDSDHTDGDDVVAADAGVILDVKFEPPPAATGALNPYERAWYETQFLNNAARTALAQRALTSFTDPWVGWARINGSHYAVRQRSAWKASFDLSQLRDYAEYAAFVSQVAASTATSHARSSVGKSPGSFKEVLAAVLGQSSARATWSMAVSLTAAAYHEQVQLDYACFSEYYKQTFLALELQAGGRGGAVAHEDAWEHGEL